MEEYKIIKGYENYSVSNFGNVKNNKTDRILSQKINNHGYKGLILCKEGIRKYFSVHRLVALMFIDNPDNKPLVDHIDCNKQNNNISNLRWATNQENGRNTNLSNKNTSNVKGVHFNKQKNKWQALIRIDGILIHLGYYNTLEEAKQARLKKVNEVFGEFVHPSEKI